MARRRNRYLDMESRYARAVRRNLVSARPGIHSCILVLDGLKPDFNIGKIFRSADAFGVREIHLAGIDIFDPEPAKGSVRWVPFTRHPDFASCYNLLRGRGYTLLTFEPGRGRRLDRLELPERSAFVLGHEEFGLSFDAADFPDILPVSIPQWGHVQSLKVSVAASLALYEYVRQHGRPLEEGFVRTGRERLAGEECS